MLSKRDFVLRLVSLACLAQPSLQQACALSYSQCGGAGYTGGTCCPTGWSCQTQNSYYAQCLSGTPTSSTGSVVWTGPSSTSTSPSTRTTPYRTSTTFLTGEAISTHTQLPYTTLECGNADCGSGTIFPDITTVNNSMPWHYSVSAFEPVLFRPSQADKMSRTAIHPFRRNPRWRVRVWLVRHVHNRQRLGHRLGRRLCPVLHVYPDMCADPANSTLRGNFAAPNGDYYTQFWPMLPSLSVGEEQDNYLSGGEGSALSCCPCEANPKSCCGPSVDQCQEVDAFTYGCPLPSGSIHLDLSDVAMSMTRAQAGVLAEGVIPTQYKRDGRADCQRARCHELDRTGIGNPGVLVYQHGDTVHSALSWKYGKWSEIVMLQGSAECASNSELRLHSLHCSVLGSVNNE
ncbi:hypothetical protein F5882DRAFT_482614 [Hyaloscypha sp. PMI_1271]|nr:hypothetical protein F5882DRAFT_482614 [Hyaloscypha sp. PMI_1271]